MQQPGATIRIDGELYKELRAIAVKRDCTLRQALDFWMDKRNEDKSKTGPGKKKVRREKAKKSTDGETHEEWRKRMGLDKK